MTSVNAYFTVSVLNWNWRTHKSLTILLTSFLRFDQYCIGRSHLHRILNEHTHHPDVLCGTTGESLRSWESTNGQNLTPPLPLQVFAVSIRPDDLHFPHTRLSLFLYVAVEVSSGCFGGRPRFFFSTVTGTPPIATPATTTRPSVCSLYDEIIETFGFGIVGGNSTLTSVWVKHTGGLPEETGKGCVISVVSVDAECITRIYCKHVLECGRMYMDITRIYMYKDTWSTNPESQRARRRYVIPCMYAWKYI